MTLQPDRGSRHFTAAGVGSDPRVVAIVEARTSSTRLPGKVTMDIGDSPMLAMVIERLLMAQSVDAICVATTSSPRDDVIVDIAGDCGVSVYRGSEDDVLGRVLEAARSMGADIVAEVTADCPLVEPMIVDACVMGYLASDVHLSAVNVIERTFPLGLDMKVFSTEFLAEVDRITEDPADREHVSLHMYEFPDRYRVMEFQAPPTLRRPHWRWTVDEVADLEFMREVASHVGRLSSARIIVEFLDEHPEVVSINLAIKQRVAR